MQYNPLTSHWLVTAIIGAAAIWSGCGPAEPSPGPSTAPGGTGGSPLASSGASGNSSSGGSAAGTFGTGGTQSSAGGAPGGMAGLGGGPAGGGTGNAANGGATSNGGGGGGGTGGAVAAGGSHAGGGSGGAGNGAGGGAGAPPSGCNLPATVSFKNDVQKFLSTSCSGTGCHVIDDKSTTSSGGYDHAYDWITATSHASSCPSGAPKRFEVVIAVINGANPASCSKSRVMPPDPATHAPLTPCQEATLQAWLDEPLVTQMHRADDTSPTTPYAMPPFN